MSSVVSERSCNLLSSSVQVTTADMECNTCALSPQVTEAFDKISKQGCSLSEQVAHLQLSLDSMKQPSDRGLAGDDCMFAAGSSTLQTPHLELAMEAQVGLSFGLSLVQEAVDEWFTGLRGSPARHLSLRI